MSVLLYLRIYRSDKLAGEMVLLVVPNGHIASKQHRVFAIRHIVFDSLVGPPLTDPCADASLIVHMRSFVSLRGDENWPACDKKEKGLAAPISYPRAKRYWGSDIRDFGRRCHEVLQKWVEGRSSAFYLHALPNAPCD